MAPIRTTDRVLTSGLSVAFICLPAGDPAGDVLAVREEDPLWEDGVEVQKLPRCHSSRVQTEIH